MFVSLPYTGIVFVMLPYIVFCLMVMFAGKPSE
jgi:hypothetical protein